MPDPKILLRLYQRMNFFVFVFGVRKKIEQSKKTNVCCVKYLVRENKRPSYKKKFKTRIFSSDQPHDHNLYHNLL